MRESDFAQFSAMLDDVASLLPPPQPFTPTARAMFFRALASLSIEQVRAALDAHVRDSQRGRFFPKPADVLAQVASDRPGADEAWAIAVRGRDENASIVQTTEMAEAWGIAKPVLQLGDEVGARVAFRDAYTRLVGEARKAGAAAQWFASLGHDPEGREAALREEARLTNSLFAAIAAPTRGGDPLQGMPFDVRQRLEDLRARLTGEGEPAVVDEPGADFVAKKDTEARLEEMMARSRAYAEKHGLDLTSPPRVEAPSSMPPEPERFAQEDEV